MTNLQKFAAQRLTKTEMNQVKGGEKHIWCAVILDGRADMGLAAADTVAEAEEQLHQQYDGVYDSVIVVCDERYN